MHNEPLPLALRRRVRSPGRTLPRLSSAINSMSLEVIPLLLPKPEMTNDTVWILTPCQFLRSSVALICIDIHRHLLAKVGQAWPPRQATSKRTSSSLEMLLTKRGRGKGTSTAEKGERLGKKCAFD